MKISCCIYGQSQHFVKSSLIVATYAKSVSKYNDFHRCSSISQKRYKNREIMNCWMITLVLCYPSFFKFFVVAFLSHLGFEPSVHHVVVRFVKRKPCIEHCLHLHVFTWLNALWYQTPTGSLPPVRIRRQPRENTSRDDDSFGISIQMWRSRSCLCQWSIVPRACNEESWHDEAPIVLWTNRQWLVWSVARHQNELLLQLFIIQLIYFGGVPIEAIWYFSNWTIKTVLLHAQVPILSSFLNDDTASVSCVALSTADHM